MCKNGFWKYSDYIYKDLVSNKNFLKEKINV